MARSTQRQRSSRGLTLNAEVARDAASGLLLATDVADYLVGKGVPFRDAHEIVGALVRRLSASGALSSRSRSTSGARTRRCSTRTCAARSLRKRRSQRKRTPQSTQPEAVQPSLAQFRDWIASLDR